MQVQFIAIFLMITTVGMGIASLVEYLILKNDIYALAFLVVTLICGLPGSYIIRIMIKLKLAKTLEEKQ